MKIRLLFQFSFPEGPFYRPNRPQVYMKGNPVSCDCRADPMLLKRLDQRRAEHRKDPDNPTLDDMVNFELITKGLLCHDPEWLEGKSFHNLMPRMLECPFPSATFGPGLKCPFPCNCTWTYEG